MPSDFKKPKRHKADSAGWADLRASKLPKRCCVCGTTTNLSLHHLLPKSLGGSDVLENVKWACGDGTTGCHGRIEAWDPAARRAVRDSLKPNELGYLLAHKSAAWVERYYSREAA